MFNITVQASEKAKSKCEHYKLELKDIAEITRIPEQGVKNGKGFVRGRLTKPERTDENLEYSKLLIIDADGGVGGKDTPRAYDCHKALKELGYSHVLYTTHSHTTAYHKYRVVIEMTEEIQAHELAANMDRLMDELQAQGIHLRYVKEMKVWSQLWFLPRRDDPDDLVYTQCVYLDGQMFPTIHVEKDEKREETKTESESSGDSLTLQELYANIINGIDIHPSMNNIIYQMAKDGVSKPMIKAQLEAIMNLSKEAGTERWVERFNDIERSIDGAFDRIGEEEIDFEIKIRREDRTYKKPPIPHGRLGDLIRQLLAGMQFPELEFAFPAALGLVAGICGAKFNLMSKRLTGLNMQMLIVADTGSGKGQIDEILNLVLSHGVGGKLLNELNQCGSRSFIGSNKYTAPKSLHKDLLLGRSKVACLSEAGIALGSKSGMLMDLIGYLLDNYTRSSYDKMVNTQSYTHTDDSMKPFRSPALTLIMESVSESLRKSLTDMDAINSGFMPRTTVFRIERSSGFNPDIDDRNLEQQYNFSDEVLEQLGKLIRAASTAQVGEDYKLIQIDMTKDQYLEYKRFVLSFNNSDNKTQLEIDMHSRMAHKMLKYAGILYCFNLWDGEEKCLLTDECWSWAKAMVKWEVENLWYNLAFLPQGNEYEDVYQYIIEKFKTCLDCGKINQELVKMKIIPLPILMDRVLQQRGGKVRGHINKFAAEKRMAPKPYLMTILKNMETAGMIRILDSHRLLRKGSKGIQLLEGINDDF